MWFHRRYWCPFVTQSELMMRMHTDVVALRADPAVGFRTGYDRELVRDLDRWLTRTLTELSGKRLTVTELELIIAAWRRRRAALPLKPARADVIAVVDQLV